MNGNRDQAVRLIKDVLNIAWETFGEEKFRNMEYHSIFNSVYPPPVLSEFQQSKFNWSLTYIDHFY